MFKKAIALILLLAVSGCAQHAETPGKKQTEQATNGTAPSVLPEQPERVTVYDENGRILFQGTTEQVALKGWTLLDLSVALDEQQIAALKQKAAEGDIESQIKLGEYYEHPKDKTPDLPEAIKWYSMAAKTGNIEAQNDLGDLYCDEDTEVKDLKKSHHWYLMAANQGSGYAQYMVGLNYSEGAGVAADVEQALKWFHESINHGEAQDGNAAIGDIYQYGTGVPVDLELASSYYGAAAKAGEQNSMLELATLRLRGLENQYTQLIDGAKMLELSHLSIDFANEIAWLVCTGEPQSLYSVEDAIAAMSPILDSKVRLPQEFDTLAACYARNGQFDTAVKVQNEAIALLAPQSQDKTDYDHRLALYQSGKAYLQ